MKKLTRTLAVLSAITFSFCAFSCGKTDESSVIEETSVIIDDNTSEGSVSETETDDSSASSDADDVENEGTEKNSENSSSESSDGYTAKPSDQNKDTSGNSAGSDESQISSSENGTHSPSVPDNEQNLNSTEDTPPASNNNASNQSGKSGISSSGTQNSNQNSVNVSGENNNVSPEKTEPTEPATETPAEAVKTYAAEITLGADPQFKGSNVSVSGSKVLISGGGDYLVSGSVSDGQIEVNTTEKVKLYLNGVSIANSSGPAIQITDAKRIVIVLMEGTTTVLQDGGNDKINDGVIFSNDTLEIKGSGTLEITAGNAHGIASDDDVIIQNGTVNINSIKSGIYAHDDVTVNGGTLNINGGTNGIKSKGTININGGYSVISGGTKEEKSSVYAAGALTYTGGYLFAAGNTVTAPSQTSNPYVIVGFGTSRAAGSNVSLCLNSGEMVTFTPHNNFRCVMMLAPEIMSGDYFSISVNGESYGDYYISEDQNLFTVEN